MRVWRTIVRMHPTLHILLQNLYKSSLKRETIRLTIRHRLSSMSQAFIFENNKLCARYKFFCLSYFSSPVSSHLSLFSEISLLDLCIYTKHIIRIKNPCSDYCPHLGTYLTVVISFDRCLFLARKQRSFIWLTYWFFELHSLAFQTTASFCLWCSLYTEEASVCLSQFRVKRNSLFKL